MSRGAYKPKKTRTGAVIQGAVPKVPSNGDMMARAHGLLVRGIVIATYVYDADQALPTRVTPQSTIYADVFVYSSIPGMKINFLPRCLVAQERAGLHEGDIWVPRAATLDVTGSPLNVENLRESDPFDWDGDHVLVGFMDDTFALPVVLKEVPHPNADIGKTTSDDIGKRLRLVAADDQPRQWKHRGAYWGVDSQGNWVTDLTGAHDGVYNPDGTEPDPPEDGSAGTWTVRAQKGGFAKIVGPDDQVFEMRADGTVQIVAPTGEQIIQLDPDGTLTINAPKQQSSIIISPTGQITINAGNDAQPIVVQGSQTDLQTGTVVLGDGATEAAVLGDQWASLHGDYDTQLLLLLDGIVGLLAMIVPKLTPPPTPMDPITTALTNVTTQLATTKIAVQALTTPAPLSGSVTVKD